MNEWQDEERRLEAIRALPAEPYIGLTLADAKDRAGGEGRHLRVLESLDGPRHLDLVLTRINVELDDEGRVRGADTG